MADFDHERARHLLEQTLEEVEKKHLLGTPPQVGAELAQAFDRVFSSKTQAFREVLVGCILARLNDANANVRLPYVGLGDGSFPGRDIDEKVVNPFLQSKRFPSTRGPYLSVFRRSVSFDADTRGGVRDKESYDAFLQVLQAVEDVESTERLLDLLSYLVYKFVLLRESSVVPLSRLRRISLEQCDSLISGLLETQSGGRFPVLLVTSAFLAIRQSFGLDWEIDCQGINVADKSSGAGGDITIRSGKDHAVLLAAEVTERTVDRSRVVATFNTKIALSGIEDYLFFVPQAAQASDAVKQARQYFSQGHEVNFVCIKDWIVMTLATLGVKGRDAFCRELLMGLDLGDTPKSMKVAWNEQVSRLTSANV